MSLVQGFLLTALAVLVVLHMARPRFRRLRLSAARFFHGLPPADDVRRRFQLGNPLRSRPFYPQLLVLALLAGALLSARGCERGAEEQLGLWVFVDTSYSMTTVQDGEMRIDAARREVERFLDRAVRVGSKPPCYRFSTFDMEVAPPWPDPADRPALESWLGAVAPRALGTDLGLLRELAPPEGAAADPCPADVRLVVTDLPAPDWAGEPGSGWIWRDVARPVANVGLASIEAVRGPFGGRVDAVAVEVAAWGPPAGGVRFEVLDSAGRTVEASAVDWPPEGSWRYELPAPRAGSYRLKVSPGGAYAGDDEAVIDVPEGSDLRVDWRLASPEWLERFGWSRAEGGEADLVVTTPDGEVPDRPALIVGDRYRRGPVGEIAYFEPDSQLLDGLNFDVAEEARIRGIGLPRGFEPVLAGGLKEDVWVARRSSPRGVYVPGLPTGGDDPLGRFSATLFVQSLRWLLSEAPPPAIFTLTSPAHPRPEGSRIALHQDEGRTDLEPVSRGDVDELAPAVRRPVDSPAWPWWLAGAAGVFLLEQLLLAYAGEGWR